MECIICNNTAIQLNCKHPICLSCLLNIFDGPESTKCPTCRVIIPMDEILSLNPCARCKRCPSDYCATCNNFLCSDCWSLIHSFPPLNKHKPSVYDHNPKVRKDIVQQMEQSIIQLKQIDKDLANLQNDSLKEVSVKNRTLAEIYKVFHEYRKQLNEQEQAIEQYINEQTEVKISQLLGKKSNLKLHLDQCKTNLFEHDSEPIQTVDPYVSDLEYKFVIDGRPLHQIISVPFKVVEESQSNPGLMVEPEPIVEEDVEYVKENNGRQNWYKKGTSMHHRIHGPAIVYADGAESWYKEGKLHRNGDQPAVIRSSGEQRWYKDGLLHRDGDQPAIMNPSKGDEWYQKGLLHRDNDQPARITKNGRCEWYQNGLLHRDNDQPANITPDYEQWWCHGKLHREGNHPACIYKNGRREYYRNGVLHRDGGLPAIICDDHFSCTHRYVDGIQIL